MRRGLVFDSLRSEREALHIGGDDLFRSLPWLRLFGVFADGGDGAGGGLHGVSSLALAVVFHAMRGMYLHAERLLAKAGVARRKGRGISHPWRGSRRRNGKGEAKRRSAQAQRGRLGRPLAPRDRGSAPERT
jgi:hypothetical protein